MAAHAGQRGVHNTEMRHSSRGAIGGEPDDYLAVASLRQAKDGCGNPRRELRHRDRLRDTGNAAATGVKDMQHLRGVKRAQHVIARPRLQATRVPSGSFDTGRASLAQSHGCPLKRGLACAG
jgi:hypothetical protein